MPDAAKLAFKNLERVLSRDPLLRDVLEQTIPKSRRGGHFSPNVDVIDNHDRYIVLIDVPGIPKEMLEIELEGTKLVVRGEKPSLHPEGGQVHSTERQSGAFKRVFLLPSQVLGDAVLADLTDGVLRIEVPKSGDGVRRKVKING